MCGRTSSEHNADALANPCLDEWSVASEANISTCSTTAYGEIEFPNGNIAKVSEKIVQSGPNPWWVDYLNDHLTLLVGISSQ